MVFVEIIFKIHFTLCTFIKFVFTRSGFLDQSISNLCFFSSGILHYCSTLNS